MFQDKMWFKTRQPWPLCAHSSVCSGKKKRPLKGTLYIWQEEGELVYGLKNGRATQQHLREDKPGPAFLTSNLDQKATWVGLFLPRNKCEGIPSGGLVARLFLTLKDPMDCNPPGSSVHGILQVRIQIPMSSSRGSSQLRDWSGSSKASGFLTVWGIRKAQETQ